MERFDIPGRLRAVREAIGADADRIDLAEWAVRLMGPHCLRLSSVQKRERDPLLHTADGYRILLHRSVLEDRGKLQHDLAFAIARWALRDVADDPRLSRACVLFAHAICASKSFPALRTRGASFAAPWEASQTA